MKKKQKNDTLLTTNHAIHCTDARMLSMLDDQSIDLVVTSPPYPMIQMWDDIFRMMSPEADRALATEDGNNAFEAMHRELDSVWRECYRLLAPGGFACINIGDATRTIAKNFRLYSNHSRIISSCIAAGFDTLPVILWRKQTNAPNKFMGSGMLPAGAYVTLEHEYILVFRKGNKREFTSSKEKLQRMQGAYFWEERNNWFSDIWDFKGTRQQLTDKALRERSGAFPFELPYRLIMMYSRYGDTVLDPFTGTGTTQAAALSCGRNSVGVEYDKELAATIGDQLLACRESVNGLVAERINRHQNFIAERTIAKGPPKYKNNPHGFPVMTKQESELTLYSVEQVERNDDTITAEYRQLDEIGDRRCQEMFGAVTVL